MKNKQAKREKRRKKHRHLKSLRSSYLKKYPNLVLSHDYANIDLVNELNNICQNFDIRKHAKDYQLIMFEDHKRLTHHQLVNKYKIEENDEDFDELDFHSVANRDYCEFSCYNYLEDQIILFLFYELKERGLWDKYMPLHNIMAHTYQGDFVILLSCFHQHHSSYGKGYYGERAHFVDVPDEKGNINKYQIAASMHALNRYYERVYRNNLDSDLAQSEYPCAIYSFGVNAEFVPVKNDDEWLIAIFIVYKHGPEFASSIHHKIAYEILDKMENFKILCGYCPIGFCKDDFIHLKTLLSPGMRGTPENKLIRELSDKDLKDKYEKLISKISFGEEHIELYHFFQNSGYHIAKYL